MNALVVTADDFGLAREVNEAVEIAHTRGILTAASLMVGAPAADDAVERARRMPRLKVGLHLVLVEGRPVLPPEAVPDLVDQHGCFRNDMTRAGIAIFLRPAVQRQVAAEIEAQFAAFAATGLALDHVNAHKHFHLHPTIARQVVAIGARYGMDTVRVPDEPAARLRRIDPTTPAFVDAVALHDAAATSTRARGPGERRPRVRARVVGRDDGPTDGRAAARPAAGLQRDLPASGNRRSLPGFVRRLSVHERTRRADRAVDARRDARAARCRTGIERRMKPPRPGRHDAHEARARAAGSRLGTLIAVVAAIGLCGSLWMFGPELLAAFATLTRAGNVAALFGYAAYSCAVLALLGAAWLVAAGAPLRLVGVFAWARIVREAAADLLPFSQVGAIVISFRVVLASGVEAAVVYASFVADLATELGSQLLFVAFGLLALWAAPATNVDLDVTVSLAVGVALLVALTAASASARWTLPIAQRLVGVAMPGAAAVLASTSVRLVDVYRRRTRIAITFLLNLLGWFASAAGVWLALRWVGIDVPMARIVSLESLICVLRSVAFAIPAGIGVQEAGYGLLGPLVGLPLEAALSIALLKRLRDVVVALPVLVIWQASTFGRLSVRPRSQP